MKLSLWRNTGDYDEWLIEQLKDPEEALVYLEAALKHMKRTVMILP